MWCFGALWKGLILGHLISLTSKTWGQFWTSWIQMSGISGHNNSETLLPYDRKGFCGDSTSERKNPHYHDYLIMISVDRPICFGLVYHWKESSWRQVLNLSCGLYISYRPRCKLSGQGCYGHFDDYFARWAHSTCDSDHWIVTKIAEKGAILRECLRTKLSVEWEK